jgi:hypothetical protein
MHAMLESSISAKSSIPSNVLDDDDSIEELPNHIPSYYIDFANVFSACQCSSL